MENLKKVIEQTEEQISQAESETLERIGTLSRVPEKRTGSNGHIHAGKAP